MPLSFKWLHRWPGIALIVAGLALNKWVLQAALAPDGEISSAPAVVAIAALQLLLAGSGVLLLIRPPSFAWSWSELLWLVLGAAIAPLGLAELGLRLHPAFRPDPPAAVGQHQNRPSPNFIVDERTGWRMRPSREFRGRFAGTRHTYRANAQGFRMPFDIDQADQRRHVAMIGDSFTWGAGVRQADTYPALIDSALAGAAVYNFAMPGFGIDQMLLSLRHQALGLVPDLVIVAFIDEDFDRSLTAYRTAEGFGKPMFALDRSGLRPLTAADRPPWLLRQLQEHSAMWTAVQSMTRSLAYRVPVGTWWSLNASLLRAMNDECRARGVPIVFVRLPRRGGAPEFPTLRDHMQAIGADYVDLADTRRPSKEWHFDDDDHITAAGHRFVAERLLQRVRQSWPELWKPEAAARP